VKIFFGILYSSILSRYPSQLILCPLIHFTMFSPLLISSSTWGLRSTDIWYSFARVKCVSFVLHLVYMLTISMDQTVWRRIIGILVNNELERIWNE
jgi:hypothetical protein